MRLGGQIFEKYDSPEQWGQAVQRAGYRAVICPVEPDAGDDEVRAYADVAAEADILIAEVGTWSNPLSGDDAKRNAALQKCRDGLALADRIGSRCCVNIAGSRGEKWDGPHRADLTEESFEMIVETVRRIIDEVQPIRTHFTLEPMPWMFPDSA
ncbi:MAG: TIM barrel protein, partial [Planctomycetota bacterium]